MTRAEDLDGALCSAPDSSRLGGSGRLHDESGVKEKAPPSPGGGGADDICCLCSFLDVPPDKATRGARDGSPSGLTLRQGARVIEDSRRLRAGAFGLLQADLEVPNDAGLGLRWRAPHPRPFYDTQMPPGIQSRAACAMNCRLSGSVTKRQGT